MKTATDHQHLERVMTDYTLGGNLADPMEPLDVKFDAGPLQWKTTREDLDWDWHVRGEPVVAFVSTYDHPQDERHRVAPWRAICFGPNESELDDWFATAEAARAAVAEHIAAHIDPTEEAAS